MIHVVVPMLSIPAHAVQVFDAVQIVAKLIDLCIGIKISGIGFEDALPVGVKHILGLGQNPHGNQFFDSEGYTVLFRHTPKIVALFTEILQANPYGMLRILD